MATTADANDIHHMRAALALARRGLGAVWPNPAVGCVLVRDGRVVIIYLHVTPNYTRLNWFAGSANAYASPSANAVVPELTATP